MTKAYVACAASSPISILSSCLASSPLLTKGKDKFTPAEAVHGRGIARNRYVVEITYKRVKEWHLLKEIVPSEKFHLMNSAWWWALGFGNIALKFLQPPPDAETLAQREKREKRTATDQRDAQVEAGLLRVAAEAARAP